MTSGQSDMCEESGRSRRVVVLVYFTNVDIRWAHALLSLSLDHGVVNEKNQPRAHNDIGNAVRAVKAANIIYELAFKF